MVKNKVEINMKPTPGYLLIEPLEAETKTASGIYLPESASEKPQKGKVIAIGDEEMLDNGQTRKAPCIVGDSVIYKKWGGDEIKISGKEYLFAKFDSILAVETN